MSYIRVYILYKSDRYENISKNRSVLTVWRPKFEGYHDNQFFRQQITFGVDGNRQFVRIVPVLAIELYEN